MLPVMKDKRVLKERIKELNTILSVTEILFKTPTRGMPGGMPARNKRRLAAFADHMGVRIKLQNGREYKTGNFRETEWRLSSGLERSGHSSVTVEVCFVELLPDANMIFLRRRRT